MNGELLETSINIVYICPPMNQLYDSLQLLWNSLGMFLQLFLTY